MDKRRCLILSQKTLLSKSRLDFEQNMSQLCIGMMIDHQHYLYEDIKEGLNLWIKMNAESIVRSEDCREQQL